MLKSILCCSFCVQDTEKFVFTNFLDYIWTQETRNILRIENHCCIQPSTCTELHIKGTLIINIHTEAYGETWPFCWRRSLFSYSGSILFDSVFYDEIEESFISWQPESKKENHQAHAQTKMCKQDANYKLVTPPNCFRFETADKFTLKNIYKQYNKITKPIFI